MRVAGGSNGGLREECMLLTLQGRGASINTFRENKETKINHWGFNSKCGRPLYCIVDMDVSVCICLVGCHCHYTQSNQYCMF